MGFRRRPRRTVIPSLARDLALNVLALRFGHFLSPLVTHHSSLPLSFPAFKSHKSLFFMSKNW
jgi:hypothetical protein